MRYATIVGAGCFGAWTAYHLTQRGWKVTLIDQHGPGNSRSSSGGETRILRSGYGRLPVYARWARASLADWLALEVEAEELLFVRTGALFLGRDAAWLTDTTATLESERIACTRLAPDALRARFPQLTFPEDASGVLEPDAGVLFARRSVQALVRLLVRSGVTFVHRAVVAADEIATTTADAVIFACGPWLPSMFPELREVILPTRQKVYFFGAPPGDDRFMASRLPAWVAFDEGIYGLPDLEHRGVKVAVDAHGAVADPESMDRAVDAQSIDAMRRVLEQRLPALAAAPLLEARVCQYENTPDGHFLIDRLPSHERVWIAGGGSGHGFKHGPEVGRYVADLIEDRRTPEPAFALEGRPPRRRGVF